jgi:hypothetical protein
MDCGQADDCCPRYCTSVQCLLGACAAPVAIVRVTAHVRTLHSSHTRHSPVHVPLGGAGRSSLRLMSHCITLGGTVAQHTGGTSVTPALVPLVTPPALAAPAAGGKGGDLNPAAAAAKAVGLPAPAAAAAAAAAAFTPTPSPAAASRRASSPPLPVTPAGTGVAWLLAPPPTPGLGAAATAAAAAAMAVALAPSDGGSTWRWAAGAGGCTTPASGTIGCCCCCCSACLQARIAASGTAFGGCFFKGTCDRLAVAPVTPEGGVG